MSFIFIPSFIRLNCLISAYIYTVKWNARFCLSLAIDGAAVVAGIIRFYLKCLVSCHPSLFPFRLHTYNIFFDLKILLCSLFLLLIRAPIQCIEYIVCLYIPLLFSTSPHTCTSFPLISFAFSAQLHVFILYTVLVLFFLCLSIK